MNYKTLFLIILLLSVGFVFIRSVNAAASFYDDFETGTTAAWTGVTQASGGVVTVDTTYAHNGTYAINSTVTATANSQAQPYKTITALTTIYVRYYVLFVNLPAIATYNYISPRLRTASSTIANVEVKTVASGVHNWGLWFMSIRYWSSNTTINVGQWYCIELKAVISSTVGEARLYVDDVEVVTKTGINSGSTGISNIFIGLFRDTSTSTQTAYFDSVIVSNEYIGFYNAPKYISTTTNSTYASYPCVFTSYWNDSYDALSFYIFSWNGTGTWENDTAVAFTTTPENVTVIKWLPWQIGYVVQYLWYVNNTLSSWNSTNVESFSIIQYSPIYPLIYAALALGIIALACVIILAEKRRR